MKPLRIFFSVTLCVDLIIREKEQSYHFQRVFWIDKCLKIIFFYIVVTVQGNWFMELCKMV